MNAPLFFENAGDVRGTPQDFFDTLNAEFHFDIDCAADAHNHKCELYFGEGGMAFDALEADWCGLTCFLNPPYSTAGAFVEKARQEADKGATVVLLLPVRSDTKYWHKFIWDKTVHDWRPGVQGRFVEGRLQFTLHVPDDMRRWIKTEYAQTMANTENFRAEAKAVFFRRATAETGLPKMAIERILLDYPEDDLLEGAPFPSCVVIFTKAR